MPFPEALDSDGVLIIHDGALTEHLAHHLDLDPTREQQKQLGIICLANQTSVWIRSLGSGKGNRPWPKDSREEQSSRILQGRTGFRYLT